MTIGLTEKGEVVFTGTLPWALEVENALVRQIDPKDVARLKEMLKRMYANIRAEFGEPEDADEPVAADAGVLDL